MKLYGKIPRWVSWGLIFPLLVLNGWLLVVIFDYFRSLISIFLAANLLAFILNYGVNFLVNQGMKRHQAVLGVVLMALLFLAIATLTLAPIIIAQLNDFATRFPSWIESGKEQLEEFSLWTTQRRFPLNFTGISLQLTERILSQLQVASGEVFKLALGTLDGVFHILLTLVFTFYLLLHGQPLWDGIWEWFPQPLGGLLRQSLRQSFHNYFIGQASLAAIIGVSAIATFTALQVPFSLLFGLGVGFMALFPFGAGLSIVLVSLLMILQDFWLGVKVFLVAFSVEQIIENGIAPRLLAGFTGLNPIWVLVSLLIGAKLGGLLGVLIAVPSAGFIKSLLNLWKAYSVSGTLKSESLESSTLDLEYERKS